tara:strand:+ start:2549 stop:3541 length:993 start_codon:yes stop_codon:yes gene_type:complete
MIISKTPFRISFFGGGTDLPEYFTSNKGAVISTTINKYIYHTVSEHPKEINSSSIKIVYSKVENTSKISDLKHRPFREILKLMGIKNNIEVHVISDLPSFSGLGGSSSFTVGLIKVLTEYKKMTISKKNLALKAIDIERNILKESVGMQDQTAASFGGLNLIEFNNLNNVIVKPIKINQFFLKKLNNSLMLFFTGIKRRAQDIEEKKIKNIDNISRNLDEIYITTYKALNILEIEQDIYKFGKLLNDTWNLKRQLDKSVSNKIVDQMYQKAIQAGAIGGKLLGAGGGGFMLFVAPQKKKKDIKMALKNFYEVDFDIFSEGSKIIQGNIKT